MTIEAVTSAPGEAAARERLERLFAGFDRLTPDELGRIGYRLADEEERQSLLDAVDEAMVRTGRTALVDEARELARETVLRRYAAGTLHPTWVALNWGVSQGTVEDRVAIVEALADAAAAVVVEDALDPEVAAVLALDADHVVGLAVGAASDGALARALEEPADSDLGPSRAGRDLRLAFVVLVLAFAGVGAGGSMGIGVGVAVGVALLVVAVNRRGRRHSEG